MKPLHLVILLNGLWTNFKHGAHIITTRFIHSYQYLRKFSHCECTLQLYTVIVIKMYLENVRGIFSHVLPE